ncbi:superoxide dismutase family protein [Pseudonocardia sp. WMMC193]|uniref:superoxide dismutase family protein n=1 Tax=Pseudonocardia sp. WMMC193 TaxID=2911965 RepID=UPI001F284648|nr:superoxide dismutase family protein [Pseudonocardia sp. WMMC193]MCF7549246.1 superoxide dismutase family protein [Pseudonocardia sp. WMMC193]
MLSTRLLLLPVAAAAVLLAGCGSSPAAPSSPSSSASSSSSSAVDVTGTFGTQGVALTYDPELVPEGATARVTGETTDATSTITLAVTGLLPNRTYGAHAHQKACGPAAADSGPHFQHAADPVTPSVDPAFANPANEVWLDFTTDASGAGSVTATQAEWAFTPDRAAQSVVVHEKATATEAGKAGTAGDRVGCVTVDFAP